MSPTARRRTFPATIAAALLSARSAGLSASAVYLSRFAQQRGLQPPTLETSLRAMMVLGGLLAALWLWTAICCARHKPSWIALGTMGLSAAEIAYFSLPALVKSLVGAEPFDVVDTVMALLGIALVAIVILWRPR
jgi:hypothetical protein